MFGIDDGDVVAFVRAASLGLQDGGWTSYPGLRDVPKGPSCPRSRFGLVYFCRSPTAIRGFALIPVVHAVLYCKHQFVV